MDIRTFNAVGLILKRSDLNKKKKFYGKSKVTLTTVFGTILD